MKKIILSILTLITFVLLASSCNKRVDCLCTVTPVETNTDLESSEFIHTFPRGGDCADMSGAIIYNGADYIAECEEMELLDQPDPKGEE
jgi:hypothetical protein